MENVVVIAMNEDLILEILVRLPPISVVRFKLVSKTWYALISLPNFLVRHSFYYRNHIQETRRNDRLSDGLCFGPKLARGRFAPCRYYPFEHQPDYLIFPPPSSNPDNHTHPPILHTLKEDDHPLAFFPIARPPMNNNVHHPMAKFSFFSMSSFCNGLVIFRGHDSSERMHNGTETLYSAYFPLEHLYDTSYFLCNPILKQYIELPRINPLLLHENDHLKPKHEYEPTILFDPAISLSYKVIRFLVLTCNDYKDAFLQMFVYSQPPPPPSSSSVEILTTTTTISSSSSWRLVASFQWDDVLDTNNGVFLNGVLYSLCRKGDFIICFDVVKEIVWFLYRPSKPIKTWRNCHNLGECGGHLQLVEEYSRYSSRLAGFHVFEMEHQQQQHDHDLEVIHPAIWTLKYRVNNIEPPPSYHPILRDSDIRVMRLYKTGRKGEDGKEEEALLMKMCHWMDKKDIIIFEFNLTSNTVGELVDIPFSHYAHNYGDVFPYTMTLFPLSPRSSSSSS